MIRIDYKEFVGIDEMVSAIKKEFERIQNVRHVTFDEAIK